MLLGAEAPGPAPSEGPGPPSRPPRGPLTEGGCAAAAPDPDAERGSSQRPPATPRGQEARLEGPPPRCRSFSLPDTILQAAQFLRQRRRPPPGPEGGEAARTRR